MASPAPAQRRRPAHPAMAVPGRAQPADRREPGRAGPAGERTGAACRGDRDRFRNGGGPGPAARFRRDPAPVTGPPERARGDLLPGRDHGGGRARAWHTARYGQITAALRAGCVAPAPRRARRDRVLMADLMPRDITAADADGEQAAAAARPRPGRHLIAVMLLTAAALDLTQCGLVLTAPRHPAPTAGLAAAGLAAAVLSVRTARGCQAGRRSAGWAALTIGAASAPQAAMSGFQGLYAIPDTATAVVGVLLAVAILATAGAAGQPGQYRLREERRGAAGRPLTRMPAPGPASAGLCCHCGGAESVSAKPEPAGRQEP